MPALSAKAVKRKRGRRSGMRRGKEERKRRGGKRTQNLGSEATVQRQPRINATPPQKIATVSCTTQPHSQQKSAVCKICDQGKWYRNPGQSKYYWPGPALQHMAGASIRHRGTQHSMAGRHDREGRTLTAIIHFSSIRDRGFFGKLRFDGKSARLAYQIC